MSAIISGAALGVLLLVAVFLLIRQTIKQGKQKERDRFNNNSQS